MPSDRVANIDTIAGLMPAANRPPMGRFTGMSAGRDHRFGAVRPRGDHVPPPRRVALDGQRLPPVQPAAVASAIQLADFTVALIAGGASFALQSGIARPPGALPVATALMVMALMTRSLVPSTRTEVTRQGLAKQLGDGTAHALVAFGFA